MITRSLDLNKDWTFGKGKQNYKKDNDAVAQSIQTRIMSFLNDCFFDSSAGIDWFTLLGSKNIQGLTIQIRSIILETTGVNELIDLSLNLDQNRSLSVSYSVTTDYSTSVQSTVTVG